MMMSGKDFWKSHILSWRRKVYSDWKMLHLPAGHSKSLGQQPGKHGYRQLITWTVALYSLWVLTHQNRPFCRPLTTSNDLTGNRYKLKVSWILCGVSKIFCVVLQNENSTGHVQVIGGDTLANLQGKVSSAQRAIKRHFEVFLKCIYALLLQ